MEEELRDRITKLLKSSDKEMRQLGVHLFKTINPRNYMTFMAIRKGLTGNESQTAHIELAEMLISLKYAEG